MRYFKCLFISKNVNFHLFLINKLINKVFHDKRDIRAMLAQLG